MAPSGRSLLKASRSEWLPEDNARGPPPNAVRMSRTAARGTLYHPPGPPSFK